MLVYPNSWIEHTHQPGQPVQCAAMGAGRARNITPPREPRQHEYRCNNGQGEEGQDEAESVQNQEYVGMGWEQKVSGNKI